MYHYICPSSFHLHQVPIAVGTLRVPILHHFPFLILLSTIATFTVSFLITKSGSLRYFFGLPTAADAFIPGKALKGLVPGIVLAVVIIAHALYCEARKPVKSKVCDED